MSNFWVGRGEYIPYLPLEYRGSVEDSREEMVKQ